MKFLDFLKPRNRQHGTYRPRDPNAPRPEPDEPTPPPDPPRSPKPERNQSQAETHRKEFLRVFKELTYINNPWSVWQDFVVMFACALSNPVDNEHYDEREALYLNLIKKYKKEDQQLFHELVAETVMALEENPEQDFLGKLYMELDLGNKGKAQIFTPYHVCDLMAKVGMSDDVAAQVEEKGYISINDPCCGAGATLIAGIHEARRQLEKVKLNYTAIFNGFNCFYYVDDLYGKLPDQHKCPQCGTYIP